MSLLRIESVSRRFGGVAALSDVSFEVECGGIHGLIGPNGAGKTTLVNVLTGFFAPSSGRAMLGEVELTRLPAHRICAAGVARTFQNIRLFPTLSCLDNVLAGQHLHARRPLLPRLLCLGSVAREESALRREAETLLERVGLAHRTLDEAKDLSYGERRRLEIARALATKPKLLLLDEPVAGMRARGTQEVAELVRSLAGEGMTILLIEHNMNFVMNLCPQLTVLQFGRVIASGPREQVRNDAAVIEAYLGSEHA